MYDNKSLSVKETVVLPCGLLRNSHILNNLLGSFTTVNLWIVAVVSPLLRVNMERFGGSVHSAFSHSLSLINSPLW